MAWPTWGRVGLYLQLSELLAELPPIGIYVGDGVVAEEELEECIEPVQRTAVHLRQAVEVQVTGKEKEHVRVDVELWEM